MAEAPDLSTWIGRSAFAQDVLRPWPAAALTAALDRRDPPSQGDPLPPFWHQLYFPPTVSASETGPDGHAARGGFLPPVALPRRMWAGGRLQFHQPLRIGEAVRKVSTITAVTAKTGRSGPLVLVTVEHAISGPEGLALVEEHDIVYREAAATPAVPIPTPSPGVWARRWRPDPVLLFRYSALTFNSHRIHYDHAYATAVEGYPGLVVHGPLLATLMLDLLRDAAPGATLRRFTFRALAPVFAGEEISIEGDGTGALWASRPNGSLAMQGTAEL